MPKPLIITLMGLVVLLAAVLVYHVISSGKTTESGSDLYMPKIQTQKALAASLKKICQKYNQPAMACALIHKDEILIQAAVGTVAAGETMPVDEKSRFHLGSITKSMTALIIELLVRDGMLRYDMTLEEALPQVEMREEYRNITLHELLLHKGGIIAFQRTDVEDPSIAQALWVDIPAKYPDLTKQREEMARLALNLPPINTPGTKPVYSNVGYAIAGLIAETATGKSYETLLTEMVFQPLGMTGARAGNWPASLDEPQHPRGHYPVPGKTPLAQKLEDEYVLPGWMNPSGGVHCTIQDFALYAKETLAGLQGTGILMEKAHYETIHCVRLIAGISDMYDSPGQEGEIPLGYGWIVIDDSNGAISTADGSAGTFYATIIVYPGLDLAFVGVTSCGDGKAALNKAIHEMTGFEWE